MVIDLKDQYIQQLLKELNMQHASEAEQGQALDMISERFDKVIIYTVLENLNTEQKQAFSAALADKKHVETLIENLAGDIPNLEQALQDALLTEYQALKTAMK